MLIEDRNHVQRRTSVAKNSPGERFVMGCVPISRLILIFIVRRRISKTLTGCKLVFANYRMEFIFFPLSKKERDGARFHCPSPVPSFSPSLHESHVFSLKLHPPRKYHCSNIQNGDVHCGTLEWAQCGSYVAARACCDFQLARDFFKICRTPKIKSGRGEGMGGDSQTGVRTTFDATLAAAAAK